MQGERGKVGTLRTVRDGRMLCGEAQHQERSHVSIPLSGTLVHRSFGVPARVAEAVAQVVAVCHEQFRSDPCPEAF